MKVEDALKLADACPAPLSAETQALVALAQEVRRIRALHTRLTESKHHILLGRYVEGHGTRYEAVDVDGKQSLVQPAQCLGFNCSSWGGTEGVDHLEIEWPAKNILQLTLGPDGGDLYGCVKIEQDAINHWKIRKQ